MKTTIIRLGISVTLLLLTTGAVMFWLGTRVSNKPSRETLQPVVQSPTKDQFQRHLQQVGQKAVNDNYDALFDYIKVVHALFAHYKSGTVRITSATTLDGTNDAGIGYRNIAEVSGVLHLNWENTLVGNWAGSGWTEIIFVRDWQAKTFKSLVVTSNASVWRNGVPDLTQVNLELVIIIMRRAFGV